MIFRPHKRIVYPINKNVPATAMKLGEILAVYEKTGALNAPVVEGGFEVTPDEDGKKDFPSDFTPHNMSKLDVGKKAHDALFPPTTPPTSPPTAE